MSEQKAALGRKWTLDSRVGSAVFLQPAPGFGGANRTMLQEVLQLLRPKAGRTEDATPVAPVPKAKLLNVAQRGNKLVALLRSMRLEGTFKAVSGDTSPRIYAYEDNSYLWYDPYGQLGSGWKQSDREKCEKRHPELDLSNRWLNVSSRNSDFGHFVVYQGSVIFQNGCSVVYWSINR